eukprot:scaffold8847_cov45-Phaeocystis_antarctica.AAC.1
MPYVRCAYLPPACLRHKAACPGTALLYVHSKRASLRRAVGTAHHRAPPRTTAHVPSGAPQALPVSALPPVSELQRQAHRLMLAQGSATKELSHVGH